MPSLAHTSWPVSICAGNGPMWKPRPLDLRSLALLLSGCRLPGKS